MRSSAFIAAAAFAAALACAGCSSSGSKLFVPGVPSSGDAAAAIGDAKAVKVTVNITLAAPAVARAPGHAHPHYFSPISAGALVAIYRTGTAKLVTQAAISIAPGSSACGKKTTFPRKCTLVLMVPATKFGLDFAISDYNAAPAGGKIPVTAALLGYGKLVNKTLSTKKKNNFTAYLGGVVDGLSGTTGFLSFPADGLAHGVALIIAPTDFGNNPVTGGKRDPFANPIVASVTESGGSGHALLSLDGGAGASSVTIAHSTDTVSLEYDGGGSAGYGMLVTLSAPSFRGSHGASESLQASPMYLTGGTEYTAPTLALRGSGDYQTFALSERNAPATVKYAVTPAGCNAIAMRVVPNGGGAVATFAVLAGNVASAAAPGTGCVMAVSDGTSTADVDVTNQYVGSLGTPTVTFPIGVATPSAFESIAIGPDGGMWFSQAGASSLGRVEPSSFSNVSVPAPSGTANPSEAIAGPDGGIWWLDCNNGFVGRATPASGGTAYALSSNKAYPEFAAVGADDAIWFTEDGSTANAIGRISTSGTISSFSTGITSPAAQLGGIALGPDGNVWFDEYATGNIDKITPAGTISEYPTPTAGSHPWGMTAGPDGAQWFVEYTANKIGRITTDAVPGSSAQITEFSTGITGSEPLEIATGPDGALWFTECKQSSSGALSGHYVVGRITTAGSITEYNADGPIPTKPYAIGPGPDGAIWFTESGSAQTYVGRIAIATSSGSRHVASKTHRHGH